MIVGGLDVICRHDHVQLPHLFRLQLGQPLHQPEEPVDLLRLGDSLSQRSQLAHVV